MDKLLSNSEILLTTAAVARWLGISTRAVCLWAECKEIPAIKIGRQWRFRQDELRDWLQNARDGKVRKDTAHKVFRAGEREASRSLIAASQAQSITSTAISFTGSSKIFARYSTATVSNEPGLENVFDCDC